MQWQSVNNAWNGELWYFTTPVLGHDATNHRHNHWRAPWFHQTEFSLAAAWKPCVHRETSFARTRTSSGNTCSQPHCHSAAHKTNQSKSTKLYQTNLIGQVPLSTCIRVISCLWELLLQGATQLFLAKALAQNGWWLHHCLGCGQRVNICSGWVCCEEIWV